MSKTSRKQTEDIQDKIIKELEEAPDVRLFSPFEDALIKRFYKTKGARAIAEKIGKNVKQVRGRVSSMGLARDGRGNRT